MAFIGIIVENKNEIQIKRILENSLNYKKHTVIIVNKKNIENIRNIKFETVLIIDLEESMEKKVSLILGGTKYLIINSDIKSENLEFINNLKLNIITFGFNQKATITASSVEDDLMLCLQRKIIDISENIIEPQEILVKTTEKKVVNSIHNVMGIASILLVYGKKEIFF